MAQTQLTIVNASGSAVTVWVTLGSYSSGAVDDVSDLGFITGTVPNNNLLGSFSLPGTVGSNSVSFTSQGEAFVGNLCFGSQPLNCPTADWPAATNLAEFALNTQYLPTPGPEAIDISCVAGVNAFIEFDLSGGDAWSTGPATAPIAVTTFANAAAGSNSGLVGVYPICCDICTGSAAPPQPQCPSTPPTPACEAPQTSPICNVQRDAGSGGTVTITFKGFTT